MAKRIRGTNQMNLNWEIILDYQVPPFNHKGPSKWKREAKTERGNYAGILRDGMLPALKLQ